MKRLSVIIVILILLLGGVSCGESEPGTTPQTPAENGASSPPAENEGSSPDNTPPSITNVSTSDIAETSATITWTTDEPATSQVEYGKTTNYGSATPLDETLVTSHGVTLTDLEPNTTYHFRVKSKDSSDNKAVSEDYSFAMPDTITPAEPVGLSRDNPVPMGQSLITADGIEVTVLDLIKGDAAWEIIYKANRYNDPPASGMQYLIITVKVKIYHLKKNLIGFQMIVLHWLVVQIKYLQAMNAVWSCPKREALVT